MLASLIDGQEKMIVDFHPIWAEFDVREEDLFGDWALGRVQNTLYISK
jgi:hypothetical protein